MGQGAVGKASGIVFGMGKNRDWVCAGGWGPLLSDEGSGYDVALREIRAGSVAHDGSGP